MTLANLLRAVAPRSVLRRGSYTLVYLRRLSDLWSLLLNTRGHTKKDARVFTRSMLVAVKESARDLTRWRDAQLVEDAELRVKGLGVFAIRGASDDLGHLVVKGNASLFSTIEGLLSPGDVAIDAGANIGVITVAMAHRVGPAGRVVSIEMMPDTASQLRRNIALNGCQQVRVVQNALSDRSGEMVRASVQVGQFGQATIVEHARLGASVREIAVETTTLDDVAADLPEIALMKMDLEGAEAQAIRGATATLSRIHAIVFESWKSDGGEVASQLKASGFAIERLDGRNFLARRAA